MPRGRCAFESGPGWPSLCRNESVFGAGGDGLVDDGGDGAVLRQPLELSPLQGRRMPDPSGSWSPPQPVTRVQRQVAVRQLPGLRGGAARVNLPVWIFSKMARCPVMPAGRRRPPY